MVDFDALQKKRLTKSDKIIREVKVNTLSDLKEVISKIREYDCSDNGIELSQSIEYLNDKGNMVKDDVKIFNRDINIKKLLIEGLELVRKRMEIAKKAESQASAYKDELDPNIVKWFSFSIDHQYFNVDALIKNEFDAYRYEDKLRWNIGEKIYEYDVFDDKMYLVDNDE